MRRREAAHETDAAGERRCLNCGTRLDDAYCPHCGQHDLDPRISVREFIGDLLAEHLGFDSKVGRTLLLLVRKPGELTRRFFAGHRVPYIPPLRLYLWLSVSYFLLSSFIHRVDGKTSVFETSDGIVHVDSTDAKDARAERIARAMDSVRTAMDSVRHAVDQVGALGRGTATVKNDKRRTETSLDTLHGNVVSLAVKRHIMHRVSYFKQQGKTAGIAFAEEFRHMMPDAMFLLVPAFAGLLALAYFGQHRFYAEHLVFALHMQAFAFIVLFFAKLPIPLMGVIATLYGIVYAFMALRTVYGESRARTAMKMTGLGCGYSLALGIIMGLLALGLFLFG